jgi:hypothetical protein
VVQVDHTKVDIILDVEDQRLTGRKLSLRWDMRDSGSKPTGMMEFTIITRLKHATAVAGARTKESPLG